MNGAWYYGVLGYALMYCVFLLGILAQNRKDGVKLDELDAEDWVIVLCLPFLWPLGMAYGVSLMLRGAQKLLTKEIRWPWQN